MHLWSADLDDPAHDVGTAARLLSPDESDRARRFHVERDRRRFVIGRALLRIILGRYLDRDPAGLRFAYGERGKPALADECLGLQFNLSHSSSVAAYAVARHRAVGIDIERVRDLPDMDVIATRFFASSEAQLLRALPRVAKPAAFFSCWTRKEAYIKALGTGLAARLDTFVVACLPDEPPRLRWVADDPSEPTRWSFRAFTPADEYVGAVAVEGRVVRPRYWRAPAVRGDSDP